VKLNNNILTGSNWMFIFTMTVQSVLYIHSDLQVIFK